MIQIARSLVRELRAILRRCVSRSPFPRPMVHFHGDADGLRVQFPYQDVAIEYHQPGAMAPDILILPLEAFAAFEGKNGDPVTLETGGANKVVARWTDKGVPQVVEYEADDRGKLLKFPEPPEQFSKSDPKLLLALHEAGETTAELVVRRAMNRIQLRGQSGEIVATDGKELLIQNGFAFPWSEDLLIDQVPIFACRELTRHQSVEVGKTESHVVLRIGSWTVYLLIDKEGRYPQAESVFPDESLEKTSLHINPEDAEVHRQDIGTVTRPKGRVQARHCGPQWPGRPACQGG